MSDDGLPEAVRRQAREAVDLHRRIYGEPVTASPAPNPPAADVIFTPVTPEPPPKRGRPANIKRNDLVRDVVAFAEEGKLKRPDGSALSVSGHSRSDLARAIDDFERGDDTAAEAPDKRLNEVGCAVRRHLAATGRGVRRRKKRAGDL